MLLTEEVLRQAAQEAGQAIAESFPNPEDCHHEFSPEFERKMKPILRRARYQGLYTILRRAACVLLVLVIGCGTWLGVDAQAREAFFGWVSQRVENAQRYFFSGEPTQEETPGQYILPDIPEGYQVFETYISDHEGTFVYMDEDGNFLRFEYLKENTMMTKAESFYLAGDIPKQSVSVSGTAADLYIDETGEDGNLIVWQDEAGTLLAIDGYFDGETLIRLAESIQYQP